MVISMLKIRRPLGRLIFNMGIAIPGKTVFLIETAPRLRHNNDMNYYRSCIYSSVFEKLKCSFLMILMSEYERKIH